MKKLLSIILAAAMLIGIFAVPVSADDITDDPDYVNTADYAGTYKSYYAKNDQYSALRKTPEYGGNNQILDEEDYLDMVCFLKELAYHYNEEGEVDWLLFNSGSWKGEMDAFSWLFSFGRFCYFSGTQVSPFNVGYGVYDLEFDRFISIHKASRKERYSDLGDIMAEANLGVLMGDANGDNVLDIIDATRIQMKIAGLASLPYEIEDDALDEFYGIAGRSDMNRDGNVNIKDVTAVQKCIAKLDYLA